MRIPSKAMLIVTTVFAVLFFLFFNRATTLFVACPGTLLEKFNFVMDNLMMSMKGDFISIDFSTKALFSGLFGAVIPFAILSMWMDGRNVSHHNEEHGSARWGNKKDIQRMMDKDFDRNMLFTQTEHMTLNTRQTFRNNNICLVGGSGSGKTRFFIKPNLMQMHSSYVLTSPKGVELGETGKMFRDAGYKIKVLDIKTFKGHKFNPFKYISEDSSDEDIMRLVDNIMMNTNGEKPEGTGDFWEKAERMMLSALFSFVYSEGVEHERNIPMVCKLMTLAKASEEDENFKSPLDFLFEDVLENDPDSMTAYYYTQYKLAAGKTAKSILVSVGARMIPFNMPKVRNLLMEDELELDKLGTEKTILYVNIPDTHKTFNFIAAMMYQVLFEYNIALADNEYDGALPIHIRCLLDEFANIGKIPNFETLISTIRSREISACITLQNLAQLKNMYKDSWETITGNCDTFLFLGGKEQSTLEGVSKMVGKTTINMNTKNKNRGRDKSVTYNQQAVQRDLITDSEVGLLKEDECILSIRGIPPFKSKKFDITKHKNYQKLSDYDKSNKYVFTREEQKNKLDINEIFKDIGEIQINTIENVQMVS